MSDRTSGTQGTKVDTTTNGGTTWQAVFEHENQRVVATDGRRLVSVPVEVSPGEESGRISGKLLVLPRASLVKILEAQPALYAAFALARPGYVLGDRILAAAAPMWPRGGCCSLL